MHERVLPDDGYLFHTKKSKPVELPKSLAPLADTHGHLTSFRTMRPEVALARAALAGVRLLAVPVDPSDEVPNVPEFLSWFGQVIDGAGQLLDACAARGTEPPVLLGWEDAPALVDNVHFLAGIHPYGAKKYLEDASVRERLKRLLANERCVGVGEFGLDYGPWNELSADVQIEAFRSQLRLAHELGMRVELHVRDANDDFQAHAHLDALSVLEEEGVPDAGCDLHCYTNSPEVMAPFVELGCYVAFGGAATFAKSEEIRNAVAVCPEHLILSETDCPYMAPVPMRGSECEPAMVAFSVACIARKREERGVATQAETYKAFWQNALRFFGLA